MDLKEILVLVDAANGGDVHAKAQIERTFKPGESLAVYGSLAPGKQNHHIVAPLGGEWSDGYVEGDLFQTGWGAALGYWAFLLRAGGDRIPVKVLTSHKLGDAWQMLDDFEGAEYKRILVVVRNVREPALYIVANLYAGSDKTQTGGHNR